MVMGPVPVESYRHAYRSVESEVIKIDPNKPIFVWVAVEPQARDEVVSTDKSVLYMKNLKSAPVAFWTNKGTDSLFES